VSKQIGCTCSINCSLVSLSREDASCCRESSRGLFHAFPLKILRFAATRNGNSFRTNERKRKKTIHVLSSKKFSRLSQQLDLFTASDIRDVILLASFLRQPPAKTSTYSIKSASSNGSIKCNARKRRSGSPESGLLLIFTFACIKSAYGVQ